MKLAGYNILIVEHSKAISSSLVQSLEEDGGNIFIANDHVQALALQHRWDIDIIFSDVCFLEGPGEVVAHDVIRMPANNTPLLFGFGSVSSDISLRVDAKKILKFFSLPTSFEIVSHGIAPFLYDARKHLEGLNELAKQSQIRVMLQNASVSYLIDVIEFFDDGLLAQTHKKDYDIQTFILSIYFPKMGPLHFAARIDQQTSESEFFRIKVLSHDLEKWQKMLDILNSRQSYINNFLLASSGK